MKISNFFIIRTIFIPIILLGSILIASVFTHLQVRQQAKQFEEVFRTQNVKTLAESDIFTLSNNLGQLVGKFNFKCLSAKNNGIVFLQNGQQNCSPNIFEATGKLLTSSKIHIEYVLQLPSSWYYLSVGLILIQAILAIALLVLSNYFEKRILQQEKAKAQALLDQAKQVAHDIRSPLAVINGLKLNDKISKQAIQRLNDIALNLLGQKTKKIKEISEIVSQILTEKELEYPDVSFNLRMSPGSHITSDTIMLSRILSNILNNSAEVSKVIDISVMTNKIVIRDQGPGISTEVLKSLDKSIGITTKINGNGIGLIHAKEESEKLGAKIYIKRLNIGTEVTIAWSKPPNLQIVLLEDDPLISKLWEIEAKKIGVILNRFSKSSDLYHHLTNQTKDCLVFLDQDISPTEKGSDIAIKLNELGHQNIYICTGHNPEDFLHLSDVIKEVVGKDFPLAIVQSYSVN